MEDLNFLSSDDHFPLALDDSSSFPLTLDDSLPLTWDDSFPLILDDSPPLIWDDSLPLILDDSPPLILDDSLPLTWDDSFPLILDDYPPLILDDSFPLILDDSSPLISNDSLPLARDGSFPLALDASFPLISDDSFPLALDDSFPLALDDSFLALDASFPLILDESFPLTLDECLEASEPQHVDAQRERAKLPTGSATDSFPTLRVCDASQVPGVSSELLEFSDFIAPTTEANDPTKLPFSASPSLSSSPQSTPDEFPWSFNEKGEAVCSSAPSLEVGERIPLSDVVWEVDSIDSRSASTQVILRNQLWNAEPSRVAVTIAHTVNSGVDDLMVCTDTDSGAATNPPSTLPTTLSPNSLPRSKPKPKRIRTRFNSNHDWWRATRVSIIHNGLFDPPPSTPTLLPRHTNPFRHLRQLPGRPSHSFLDVACLFYIALLIDPQAWRHRDEDTWVASRLTESDYVDLNMFIKKLLPASWAFDRFKKEFKRWKRLASAYLMLARRYSAGALWLLQDYISPLAPNAYALAISRKPFPAQTALYEAFDNTLHLRLLAQSSGADCYVEAVVGDLLKRFGGLWRRERKYGQGDGSC